MTQRSLTDEQVAQMRFLHWQGLSLRELASMYGCSIMTISLWKDMDPRRRIVKFAPRDRSVPAFDPGKLALIAKLRSNGNGSLRIATALDLPLEEVNEMYAWIARNTK